MDNALTYDELPYAWGGPAITAIFKSEPEDFTVDEELGFTPDGDGEHVFWRIEKQGISTHRLVDHLSSALGIPRRDISWAGLKDRQSLSRQWLSIRCGIRERPDPDAVASEHVRVLAECRNSRKLRIGSHQGNRFRIRLRAAKGDLDRLGGLAEQIGSQGVPNYFGSQRFGRNGNNVALARELFAGTYRPRNRNERSMLLSAVRSAGFNQLLALRVNRGCWNRFVPGDVFALEGSRSVFTPAWNGMNKEELEVLVSRLQSGDIHPSGPLPGKGDSGTGIEAEQLEKQAGLDSALMAGLVQAGLSAERRPLRLPVHDLSVEPATDDSVMIEFRLGRGAYATSVLRELVSFAAADDTGEIA